MAAESNSANGAMLSPGPAKIEVFSGHFVDLAEPDPATITLRDIARGAAFTCRYGGQVKRFYSVAEHAVLVRDLLRSQGASPELQRAGLFHDAAESYLGDVVAPLKWAMRQYTGRTVSPYDLLSDRMEDAIIERFGLDFDALHAPGLRLADMWALRIEARELSTTGGRYWRWPGVLPLDGALPDGVEWVGGLEPDVARVLWLDAAGAPADQYDPEDGTDGR